MNANLILDVDSYKVSHWLQYPPQTTALYAYVESRGGKYPVTVFFGLQYLLKRYLCQPIEPWMV
ncbi:MAG: nicotinamide phosphoribosyltransferase domain-containing protein, partial [Microcystaceae cyanobacterium]